MLRVVHEEIDAVLEPLDGIDMEVLRGVWNLDLVALLSVAYVIVGLGVHVAMHVQRVVADVLHDVDLPARRPPVRRIDPEHPDRGPHAPPCRQLRADLDPSVEPLGLTTGGQARRRDGMALEMVLARLDHQHAVLDARVFPPRLGVVLQLPVPDVPLLVIPPLRIRHTRNIELIRPDQIPLLRRGALPGQQHKHRRTVRPACHHDVFSRFIAPPVRRGGLHV